MRKLRKTRRKGGQETGSLYVAVWRTRSSVLSSLSCRHAPLRQSIKRLALMRNPITPNPTFYYSLFFSVFTVSHPMVPQRITHIALVFHCISIHFTPRHRLSILRPLSSCEFLSPWTTSLVGPTYTEILSFLNSNNNPNLINILGLD